MAVEKDKKYKIQMYMAVIMFLMGIAFGWAGFWVPPIGEISNSVLGMAGECFVLGASLLGIYSYVNFMITKLKSEIFKQDLSSDELK